MQYGIAVLLLVFFACAVQATEFFVAPAGDDHNPGTVEKPFATVPAARDAARAVIAAGLKEPVTVTLAGGTYELAESLTFGPEDSGTDTCPVTYRAATGAHVVLSGGQAITGWTKGEGDVWQTTVPGVKEGKWYFRQIWVNGRRAVRARTPNADAKPAAIALRGAKLTTDLTHYTYQFPAGTLAAWGNLADVEAVVAGDWEIARKRFATVNVATGNAEMAGPHVAPHPFIAPKAGRWCYLENAREFLDTPGEWYLDRTTGVLSYWPRPGEDLATVEVIAPRLTRLLAVKGTPERPVKQLRFVGLAFQYADWDIPAGGYLGVQACNYTTNTKDMGRMDAALRADYTDSLAFTGCTIAHMGGCGLELVTRCRNSAVEQCEVTDISGNGIILGGPKAEEDVPRDTRIVNNHVYQCGVDYAGAIGIWAAFAQRTLIAHNHVHDLPYTGISIGWDWSPLPTPARENVIEYNHIHDVMQRLGDGGGIYTLGLQPNSFLRGNYIHGVRRSALAHASPNNGMFLDEGTTGFTIEGNLISDTVGTPLRFNMATKNLIKDNIFCPLAGAQHITYGATSTANITQEGNTVVAAGGTGIPVKPGVRGNARSFDGNSTIVEAHIAALEPANLTLEAWVRLEQLPGGADSRRWIASKNASEWSDGHYALLVDGGGHVGAYLNIGGGAANNFDAMSGADVLQLGAWQHLALSYDGKTLIVYLGGKQVASREIGKVRTPGNGIFAIGKRPDGYAFLRGDVDEVALYSRALTPVEIAARAKSEGDPPDLVKRWSFDETIDIERRMGEIAAKAGIEK